MDLTPAAAAQGARLSAARSAVVLGMPLLPWLAGAYFAFRPGWVVVAARAFGQDPQLGVTLGLGVNFILAGVALFSAFGSEAQTGVAVLRSACGRWVLSFLGFSGLSLAWTMAASPAAAAAFWCGMAADVVIVVAILGAHTPAETASALIKGYIFGACCLALLGWFLPTQSDLRLGDEEYLGPNAFGYVCAFAILLGQYASRLRPSQRRWSLAAIFLAVTLLRTLSKTSIIAFLAAETFMFLRDKSVGRKIKLSMLLGVTVVVALAWNLLQSYYGVYTSAGNQAETLTGRIGLWAIFVESSLEHPWLGHGFHSVWKVVPPFGPDSFLPRHAHNELLQQFYAYGAAGVALMLGLYWSFYRRAKQLAPSPQRACLLSLLIFVLVRGFADTETFDLSLPLWAIVLLSATIGESCRLSPAPDNSNRVDSTAPESP